MPYYASTVPGVAAEAFEDHPSGEKSLEKVAEQLPAASSRRPPRHRASVLTQTRRFFSDPFSLLIESAEEYGDIFSLRLLGLGEWVFVGSPDLIRQMFKASPDVLAAGEVNRDLLGFILGRDAVFTLDGKAHRQRQRLVHPFLNGRQTHQHIPAMRDIALGVLETSPGGRPFAFLPHAHRMSLDIMVHAMFGSSDPRKVQELASLFDQFATQGVRSPLVPIRLLHLNLGRYSPWGKILRLRQKVFDAFSAEIARCIKAARESGDEVSGDEASDIVSRLASIPQKDGGYLTGESLVDEVINLLNAGHETTGNTLAWCMETLHSHPEVLQRVREELCNVLKGEPVEAEHLPDLKYLHAVIQETIRYRPLAPMAGIRRVKKSFAVGDYVIPKGMFVTQGYPIMTRRRDLFENPDRFDPMHFHGRKFKPFEWNPFGGGTRMCIGKGLAEVELKVVIATLLQSAEFQMAQEEVKPVRNGHFFSPSNGLQLIVRHKNSMEEGGES